MSGETLMIVLAVLLVLGLAMPGKRTGGYRPTGPATHPKGPIPNPFPPRKCACGRDHCLRRRVVNDNPPPNQPPSVDMRQ